MPVLDESGGKYRLVLQEDGNFVVRRVEDNKTVTWLGPDPDWRRPDPDPDPDPIPLPGRGPVTLDGNVFRDNLGRFRGFGVTLFWALWGARYDLPHLERTLDWLQQYDVNYARILTNTDREGSRIDPYYDTGGLDAHFAAQDVLFDELKARGMRVQPVLFSGGEVVPPTLRDAWVMRNAAYLNPRRKHVQFIEIGNEFLKPVHGITEDDLFRWVALWKEHSDIPVAPTAPEENDKGGRAVFNRWDREGRYYNVKTPHLPRHGDVRPWRQGYHLRDHAFWVNNEPRVEPDAGLRAIGMAIDTMSHAGGGIVHWSDSGVHNRIPFWVEPGAQAVMVACREMHRLLPVDLAHAPMWGAGKGDHPYDDHDPDQEQRVRCYGAGPVDGHYFVAVLGQQDSYEVKARFDMRVDVFDATDVSQRWDFLELREGEHHTYRHAGHYLHRITRRDG